MRELTRWLTIGIALGLLALAGVDLRGGKADEPKRLTAEDVIAQWNPKLDGTQDFQEFVASPREASGVVASTFRVVGPSFERLWNHYASLCGIDEHYEAKRFLVSAKSGPKGTYVINDRASWTTGERALSTFLLRTDRYTVTVTIQPDPDGTAMRGSITAVIL